MIAMALMCGPSLLIADEPTTALDVTTQAQILDLLRALRADFGMSTLFITHDLGVVAEMADEVVVMYLGTVVEHGPVAQVFRDPRHPYTRALLRSNPRHGGGSGRRLRVIAGGVPDLLNRPAGCPFHNRCEEAIAGTCDRLDPEPVVVGADHTARCWVADAPRHPYTSALLSAAPVFDPEERSRHHRVILSGEAPDPARLPSGCPFHPRCSHNDGAGCTIEPPVLRRTGGVPGSRVSTLRVPAIGVPASRLQAWAACHYAETLTLPGIHG